MLNMTQHSGKPGKRATSSRRATIYLAVLGTSVLVAMLSLAAIHSARMTLSSVQNNSQDFQARAAAMAAIECALAAINDDNDWRSNLTSGTVYPSGGLMLGDARISWSVIDTEDGELSNAATGRTVVHGTGEIEDTVYTYQVELLQSGSPLSCLESALHCNGSIGVGAGSYLLTNQRISTNQDAYGIFTGAIYGNVEASSAAIVGGSGERVSGVPARQMPGSDAFSYYKAMGTEIAAADLQVGAELHLEDVLLSSSDNPFGPENPEGIYWIDCQGQDLVIRQCRLVCTLVLLNTGLGATIDSAVHIEPAKRNMPSLLVDGDLYVFQNITSEINEDGQVNFNPPSQPIRGMSDSDMTDYFPSMVHGLVYVSGRLDLFVDFETSTFTGTVVCETISAFSKAHFDYTPYALNNPPPGFCMGDEVQIMPGSWQRVSAGEAVSGSGGSGTPSSPPGAQQGGSQERQSGDQSDSSRETDDLSSAQTTQSRQDGFFSKLLQLW